MTTVERGVCWGVMSVEKLSPGYFGEVCDSLMEIRNKSSLLKICAGQMSNKSRSKVLGRCCAVLSIVEALMSLCISLLNSV